jgi:hypothetical protein
MSDYDERPRSIEDEETAAAAREAAAIGGRVSDVLPGDAEDVPDEAHRPLVEAGEGEAEGFEEAERLLRDHATHGDQHAARRVLQDASSRSEDARVADDGEADHERSSEREDDD